ncbi:MAG: cyclic nucleotide-binding domain-containing protein, partial [Rhodospirillaceae bacterium]
MAGSENSLADIPFLEALSDASRSALEQRARWVRYKTNETIIDRETDSRDVYFVVEGRVRVVNFSISGREISFD